MTSHVKFTVFFLNKVFSLVFLGVIICDAILMKTLSQTAVKTSVGESKTKVVKNSVGQGSFGAALASSLNIGSAIQDTFKWTKSASIVGHIIGEKNFQIILAGSFFGAIIYVKSEFGLKK